MNSARRPPFPRPLLAFWGLRILPVWILIALAIFIIQIAICGIVHDNEKVKALIRFIDVLPPMVKTALGGEGLESGHVSGLIGIGYQHPLVLLLYMLFAVGVPSSFLTGEVQNGTMELILSRWATKTQVFLCALILTLAGMFALVIVMFLGTCVATGIYHFKEPVPLRLFFITAINGGLLAAACGAVALFSVSFFQRTSTAVAVSSGFLVVNFLASVLSKWWPVLEFLGPATLFHYVDGPYIFSRGAWPLGDMAILVAVTIVACGCGGVIWHRRDLPLGLSDSTESF